MKNALEQPLNPPSSTYMSAHHRFTLAWSGCAFLLIVAGALVTSNDAGLAVPDWPTSFGSIYRIPPLVGGVKFEHTHRMIAELVGLLTIVFAVWTQLRETRTWMKYFGWTMLGLVIFQGVLGGITVLMKLPWYVSTFHAMVAQTFFALVVLSVFFTADDWNAGAQARRKHSGLLRTLSVLAVMAVYMQLFFGAAFRHNGMEFLPYGTRILPHLLGAGVATIILMATAIVTLVRYSDVEELRRPAVAMLWLLVTQLALGFAAYLTRIVLGKDAPQPLPSMVASTVAHVACGALLLASSLLLAVQVRRQLVHESAATANARDQKAVVA